MFRSSERNAALELQSRIVCPGRFTRSVGQGLKALSGTALRLSCCRGCLTGSGPDVRPLGRCFDCAARAGEGDAGGGGPGAGTARALPLTPRFFFLGFSESTKETLHQLLVGKRQRPAAELCAPVPGLVNFPLSDRLRYSGPGQGLSFFIYHGFFNHLRNKKTSLPL